LVGTGGFSPRFGAVRWRTVSRIFVSHSSTDNRQAQALRAWLVAQNPPLANEIFLDTDSDTGPKPRLNLKAFEQRCP
jgi:hypothetical protein